MAKRISSGEPKPRRTTTRRRTTKPAAEAAPAAQPAAETEAPVSGTARPARGAELAGGLDVESGLMTSEPGRGAVAGATQGTLAAKVAHAASSAGVWGREPDRQAIARRAFELFLARGGVHGHDVEDWLAAERELRRR